MSRIRGTPGAFQQPAVSPEAIMPSSRTRTVGVLLTLALLLGLHSAAFAQTGAASGVTVTATNQATSVAYTAVSNAAGNYTITSVPVGAYVVKAELSGFKTVTTKAIELEAKQIARLDLKMEVGA